LKNPPRGGQNLSERYRRLERSLRVKEVLVKETGVLTPHSVSNYEDKSNRNSVKVSNPSLLLKKKSVEMFHGLEVPQEPREPASDECCMSGCAVCVYDLYDESMDAYLDAVQAFSSSLTSLNIPKSEWPPSIQSSSSPLPSGSDKQRKDVVMSAFEELERALRAKEHTNSRVDSLGR